MTSSAQAPSARVLGFNHVNLVVADVDRSVAFYCDGLGLTVKSRTDDLTFLTTPGASDLVTLQQSGGPLDGLSGKQRRPGDSGGVDHLGFDVAAADLDAVLASVVVAGGAEVLRLEESGEPIVFVSDPDGYLLQLTPR
jgi:glyoxylase I family protein